jgi:hypothetical protein
VSDEITPYRTEIGPSAHDHEDNHFGEQRSRVYSKFTPVNFAAGMLAGSKMQRNPVAISGWRGGRAY